MNKNAQEEKEFKEKKNSQQKETVNSKSKLAE